MKEYYISLEKLKKENHKIQKQNIFEEIIADLRSKYASFKEISIME